ncbi:unnamed protein product [Lepidochelys kempii]
MCRGKTGELQLNGWLATAGITSCNPDGAGQLQEGLGAITEELHSIRQGKAAQRDQFPGRSIQGKITMQKMPARDSKQPREAAGDISKPSLTGQLRDPRLGLRGEGRLASPYHSSQGRE